MQNGTHTPDAETRRVFISSKMWLVFIKDYHLHVCYTVDLAKAEQMLIAKPGVLSLCLTEHTFDIILYRTYKSVPQRNKEKYNSS